MKKLLWLILVSVGGYSAYCLLDIGGQPVVARYATVLPVPFVPLDLPPERYGHDRRFNQLMTGRLDRGCQITIKPPAGGIWLVSCAYLTERLADGSLGARQSVWEDDGSRWADCYSRSVGDDTWQRHDKSMLRITSETEILMLPLRVSGVRPVGLLISVARPRDVAEGQNDLRWPQATIWSVYPEE